MIKHCEKTALALPAEEEILTLAEGTCPVDWARGVAEAGYLAACGKGTFCRDGMAQLFQIVDDISRDKGKDGDLALLSELCGDIALAGDCTLSVTCARLVALSLETYREEWDAHLSRKRCTALVCPGCYTVHADPGKCTGCGKCAEICPAHCIEGGEGMIHVVDNATCTRCGKCFGVCPTEAFAKAGAVKPRVPESPVPVGSFSSGAVRRRRRGGTD